MADFVRQMSRSDSRVFGGTRGKRSRRGPRFQERRWESGIEFVFISFLHFSVGVVAGGVVFFFLFGVVVVALSLALEVCGRCLDPNTNPMAA
jgi:hypothetical protein